jgi:hypothetical protein
MTDIHFKLKETEQKLMSLAIIQRSRARAPVIGKYYAYVQFMKLKCLNKMMGTDALFAVQNFWSMMICKSITKGHIRVENENPKQASR